MRAGTKGTGIGPIYDVQNRHDVRVSSTKRAQILSCANKRKMVAVLSMNATTLCLWASLQVMLFPLPVSAQARNVPIEEPIWAKNATALNCRRGRAPIEAPDHLASVRTVCLKVTGDSVAAKLELVTADGKRQEVGLRIGASEVFWAPNSKSFLVNGGESAIAGFFVDVYQIMDSGRVAVRTVTNAAQRDMVRSFPPCKASHRYEKECAEYARDPEYNMSGLGWSNDSSTIYVFAEVPCNSRYGGIMCQVLGYELSVPRGRILKRLSATQAKQEWGTLAAWRIWIPEPPDYEPERLTR